MTLVLHKASAFEADVVRQFGWYQEVSGEAVSWRFFEAVDRTLTP